MGRTSRTSAAAHPEKICWIRLLTLNCTRGGLWQ
jgi:hypothetical protein